MKQPNQRLRTLTRSAFFALFLVAPVLDLFRYDLTAGHFVIFTYPLSLGLESIQGNDAALQILLRVLLPAVILIALGIWIAYRFGRLYCGWLCPHFSVVELINGRMEKLLGRPTIWEAGSKPHSVSSWLILVIVAVFIAFTWAVGLLGYLLPPLELYQDLLTGELGFTSWLFLGVATTLFTIDFLFARHLFCKFGCALGVFQSLVWMMNPKALMVSFDAGRAALCKDCDKACDKACPMRLPARSIKRKKFTCTQCSECIQACNQVQKDNPDGSLLHWGNGDPRRSSDADKIIPSVDIGARK